MAKKRLKTQLTLVLVKPDGLKKSLTGNILTRLSETKLRIVGAKVVHVTKELAARHYAHLKNHPHFDEILEYFMGKPYGKEYERVMALVYSGTNAIQKVRDLAGLTNPEQAAPTSIRGQYGRVTTIGTFENVIHCSASEPEAKTEIQMWFEPDEVVSAKYPSKEKTFGKFRKRIWK